MRCDWVVQKFGKNLRLQFGEIAREKNSVCNYCGSINNSIYRTLRPSRVHKIRSTKNYCIKSSQNFSNCSMFWILQFESFSFPSFTLQLWKTANFSNSIYAIICRFNDEFNRLCICGR